MVLKNKIINALYQHVSIQFFCSFFFNFSIQKTIYKSDIFNLVLNVQNCISVPLIVTIPIYNTHLLQNNIKL